MLFCAHKAVRVRQQTVHRTCTTHVQPCYSIPACIPPPPDTAACPPLLPPSGLWIILGAGVCAALIWLIALRLWKRRRLAQKRAAAEAEAAAATAKLGIEGGPEPLVLGENGHQVTGRDGMNWCWDRMGHQVTGAHFQMNWCWENGTR